MAVVVGGSAVAVVVVVAGPRPGGADKYCRVSEVSAVYPLPTAAVRIARAVPCRLLLPQRLLPGGRYRALEGPPGWWRRRR